MKLDDFEAGQFVTVVSCLWQPTDRSYKGDVLEILLVELPYLVVKRHSGILVKVAPVGMIDTREYTFRVLSPEYVKLMADVSAKALAGKAPIGGAP